MVDVNVNDELANRLGITNASVSKLLAGAFDGAPVSTFWEGDRPVTIMLRLDQASRSSFADVRDTYVTSQVTHASVPLRAIATLEPEWQTSRIVRRNGVRTLTVRGFVEQGYYASDLLKAVQPQMNALQLPPGYRIEYGGEKIQPDETFPQMVVALGHQPGGDFPHPARAVQKHIGNPDRHVVDPAGIARRGSGADHHP